MKNIKSLAEGLKHAELNLKASLHEDGGMPVRAGWIVDECKVKLFDALTADIPLDRLCELSEAERNGRLVVLPCKVGDKAELLKEVVGMAKLAPLRRFKEYFDELYGQGLEVANWHMNGSAEPFDSFFDSALEHMDGPLPARPEKGGAK